ncbi:hypothetical protein C5167_014810 [Papaver somniferum]|uniref:Uncharacterized protein n=1 Tax=Papaver somniferum TaxID=3469 RepID=A0A4Y7J7P9_PAPSO|nr:hypothetical protein C5167_014810 [Papaver somniferum]
MEISVNLEKGTLVQPFLLIQIKTYIIEGLKGIHCQVQGTAKASRENVASFTRGQNQANANFRHHAFNMVLDPALALTKEDPEDV